MQIVGEIELKDIDRILSERGLGERGEAQKFVDSEVMRLSIPYMPCLNGVLENSMYINTTIGSGEIKQETPYARYQYYGILMVDPVTLKGAFYDSKTGRHWSRPGVSKIPDPRGRELVYNTSIHSLAGSHWFNRAMKDHGEELGHTLAELVGGEFRK